VDGLRSKEPGGKNVPKTIARSIRLTRPFRSTQEKALIALMRTTDKVQQVPREVLRPYNLSIQQYNVLRILRGAAPRGLQTYQVVERMVTRAPNITRLVDKLERKGFIRRKRSTRDMRVINLKITPKGRVLLEELDPPMDRASLQAMVGLKARELRALVELLDRLRGPHEEETQE
jgi:DNA-binding MarR family transcriptional regulator